MLSTRRDVSKLVLFAIVGGGTGVAASVTSRRLSLAYLEHAERGIYRKQGAVRAATIMSRNLPLDIYAVNTGRITAIEDCMFDLIVAPMSHFDIHDQELSLSLREGPASRHAAIWRSLDSFLHSPSADAIASKIGMRVLGIATNSLCVSNFCASNERSVSGRNVSFDANNPGNFSFTDVYAIKERTWNSLNDEAKDSVSFAIEMAVSFQRGLSSIVDLTCIT
jgi:hypothetical protein